MFNEVELIQSAAGIITPFDNTNLYVEFSDGIATTERINVDAGYPFADPDNLGEDNKIRVRCTISSTQGLFDIQQVALYNALSGGEMLISVAEALGNKGDVTWVYERDFVLTEVV